MDHEFRLEHTKEELFDFFRRSPGHYLYCIGDLDDKFWRLCKWYSISQDQQIKSVVLLYHGVDPPVLICPHFKDNFSHTQELLNRVKPLLPGKVYGHLNDGLLNGSHGFRVLSDSGRHYRMMLKQLAPASANAHVRKLTSSDLLQISELYAVAYPGNWFEPVMLEKGYYTGYFEQEKLLAIAGTHIFSPEYHVSALGNITTHPEHRGRKLATLVTSRLCSEIIKSTPIIGLNVHAENAAAINLYKKIGFEILAGYDECLLANEAMSSLAI